MNRVLDEGDSAGMLQDSFENHFIDMFLNVTHIKYITCTHSFKAALIAFLVTSWLNWPRHCMHVAYFSLWYEMIQATARAGVVPNFEPRQITTPLVRVRCGEGVRIRGGVRIRQSGSDFNEGGNNLAWRRKWAQHLCAPLGTFVRAIEHALRAQYRFRARLTRVIFKLNWKN